MENKKIEVINEIYSLILDETITEFEREKLLIAKKLFETGTSLVLVLRRLQITFFNASYKRELSPNFNYFYQSLPVRINKMQTWGGEALAVVQPL